MRGLKGVAIASAVAAMFSVAQAADKDKAPKKEAKEAAKVSCSGVNECKGKGECGGATHGCAGENACKGQGWITLSEKECKAKGGKVVETTKM